MNAFGAFLSFYNNNNIGTGDANQIFCVDYWLGNYPIVGSVISKFFPSSKLCH